MMPDLGNYATEVMTAYALSVGLLVGLLALSLRRSRKVRAQLADVEARRDRANV
ncbi:heme exporter protein D [Octadecabacter temperatus]|uniref:Heme exporter protein D n=1 Tax=Octadecabacter temperatus TaxID=1458307 RepID=A0A0K0Y6D8_9RHOB|nr:heme exporter protein CcmD [Octadecabacter temperatus]AKS46534.1 Heme exporter protein D (CcmD) [Octadecabacter temperatus]SIO16016.1 heme exporter protein D [Octadecabacter temperatus]